MFITKRKHEAAMALMAKANVDLEEQLKSARDQIETINWLSLSREQSLRKQRDEANMERLVLRERLAQIAAQATPGANATVKRMARIARGEDVQIEQQPA